MLKIKTNQIQSLVAKAFKGVGNDKIKPITELICIKVKDNTLTLITTDYDNYLYIQEQVESEDFYAVVQANQFSKLIARLTSEDVTLDVVNNCLEIKGNGTYKIPVEIDASNGQIVEYNDPVGALSEDNLKEIGSLSLQDIGTITRALKSALAITPDIPQYVNYYVADTVLATDTNIASCYGKKITDEPVLISSTLMDILTVYSDSADVRIFKYENRLLFVGNNFKAFGYAMPGVDNYAVSAINSYVNTSYPSHCKISKQALLQALDRLSLFVSAFDEDEVNIGFTADGLRLSSKQSDSVETIEYLESDNFNKTDCTVYLYMLTSQIKAQTGDSVDLYYGDLKSVKLVDNACSVTSVVCLVTD